MSTAAQTWVDKGNDLTLKEAWEEALTCFEKALELDFATPNSIHRGEVLTIALEIAIFLGNIGLSTRLIPKLHQLSNLHELDYKWSSPYKLLMQIYWYVDPVKAVETYQNKLKANADWAISIDLEHFYPELVGFDESKVELTNEMKHKLAENAVEAALQIDEYILAGNLKCTIALELTPKVAEQVRYYEEAATFFERGGNFLNALEAMNKALELSEKNEIETQSNGTLFWRKMSAHGNVCAQAPNLYTVDYQFWVFWHLASYCESEENYMEGLYWVDLAIDRDTQRLENRSEIATLLKGDFYFYQKQFSESLHIYQSGLKAIEGRNNEDEKVMAICRMAELYRETRRPVMALQCCSDLEQMKAILSDSEDDTAMDIDVFLGSFYASLGEYSLAVDKLRTLIEQFADRHDHNKVARYADELGNVYERLENYSDAILAYRKSQNAYFQLDDSESADLFDGQIEALISKTKQNALRRRYDSYRFPEHLKVPKFSAANFHASTSEQTFSNELNMILSQESLIPLAECPRSLWGVVRELRCHEEKGDFSLVENNCRIILDERPDVPFTVRIPVLVSLGIANFLKGDLEIATSIFSEISISVPEKVLTGSDYFRFIYFQGKLAEKSAKNLIAHDCFQSLYDVLTPNDAIFPYIAFMFARSLICGEHTSKAYRVLYKVVSDRKEEDWLRMELHLAFARMLKLKENFQAALIHFEIAAKIAENIIDLEQSLVIAEELTLVNLLLGNEKKAIGSYRKIRRERNKIPQRSTVVTPERAEIDYFVIFLELRRMAKRLVYGMPILIPLIMIGFSHAIFKGPWFCSWYHDLYPVLSALYFLITPILIVVLFKLGHLIKNWLGNMRKLKVAVQKARNDSDLKQLFRLQRIAARYQQVVMRFKRSEQLLAESVDLQEEYLNDLAPNARTDFFLDHLKAYQDYLFLITNIIFSRKIPVQKLLHHIELTKSRSLFSSISPSWVSAIPIDYDKIVDEIDEDTCVLSFTNINHSKDGIVVGLTKGKVEIGSLNNSKFIRRIFALFGEEIFSWTSNTDLKKEFNRRLRLWQRNDAKADLYHGFNFDRIVRFYRELIQDDFRQNDRDIVGKLLYEFLIKPIEGVLFGKSRVIIIPDGQLSILPFETLRNAKSERLIETHIVSYMPSLNISEITRKRIYKQDRQKALFIGDPIYSPLGEEIRVAQTKRELEDLEVEIGDALEENSLTDLRSQYGRLGFGSPGESPGSWSPLPGTQKELAHVREIYNNVDCITGAEASKSNLLSLSRTGKLREYRYLHFAAHGIAVPNIPQLSAIVLSQLRGPEADDGYLRLNDISRLDLQADFVNLSTCDSGLGAVQPGEGVVGMMQAFMTAGANGVGVSLWEIDDEMTAKFMNALNSSILWQGAPIADAYMDVKRGFIKGSYGPIAQLESVWSAFVYYGN